MFVMQLIKPFLQNIHKYTHFDPQKDILSVTCQCLLEFLIYIYMDVSNMYVKPFNIKVFTRQTENLRFIHVVS
jgi:hypothetical protein